MRNVLNHADLERFGIRSAVGCCCVSGSRGGGVVFTAAGSKSKNHGCTKNQCKYFCNILFHFECLLFNFVYLIL